MTTYRRNGQLIRRGYGLYHAVKRRQHIAHSFCSVRRDVDSAGEGPLRAREDDRADVCDCLDLLQCGQQLAHHLSIDHVQGWVIQRDANNWSLKVDDDAMESGFSSQCPHGVKTVCASVSWLAPATLRPRCRWSVLAAASLKQFRRARPAEKCR